MSDIAPERFFNVPGLHADPVPFFALTFDRHGTCTSPKTRAAVLAWILREKVTDAILLSHGWNNDWSDANGFYSRFITGLGQSAAVFRPPLPLGMKPLCIGIIWPSAAFVWPWEATPDIAAAPPEDVDDAAVLAGALDDAGAAALHALLAGRDQIGGAELGQLAELLAPLLADARDDAAPDDAPITPADLLRSYRQAGALLAGPGTAGRAGGFDQAGVIDAPPAGPAGPAPAGLSDLFGLRQILRLSTVLLMKDRAGVVGRMGVAETVHSILSGTMARLHLVGHSYGAKVVMTALCVGQGARRATSALLLQPAVNHQAFAAVVGTGQGGFRPAFARLEKPVLATWSTHDFPLRRVFHLAVRRRRDIGEVEFAATSPYAALGGYGPSGVAPGEVDRFAMPTPGAAYPAGTGTARIRSIDGSSGIGGHSDVTNPHTFWAMLQNLAE